MMRKRLMIAAGAAAIFVGGLLAGMISSGGLPVFAASNTPRQTQATTTSDYCQLYISTLAKQLNVSEDNLKAANQKAAQAVIDQLAKDGKITADQKSRLETELNNNASQPCAAIAKLAAGHHMHAGPGSLGALGPSLMNARQDLVNAVASAVHLTADQLTTQLTSGKSVKDIAAAQNVDISAVRTAYLSAAKADLAKAVSAKQITQAQSDMALNMIQQAVNSDHFPGLDEGRGGFGFGHP